MTKIKIKNERIYFVLSIISIILGRVFLLLGIALAIFILFKLEKIDDKSKNQKLTQTICYISIAVNFVWYVFEVLTSSSFIF